MAKVTFMPLIEKACGKIGDGYGFRCTPSGHSVTVKYGQRSTAPSQSELAQRSLFKQVAAATRARMADEDQKAADMIAYRANNGGCKTLYSYVFKQEWAKAQTQSGSQG